MTLKENVREESEIFSDLRKLCSSPGYAHAIAYFCYRDNTIKYVEGNMTVDDVLQQFSMERLVRTEVSTLIGLMNKVDSSAELPSPEIMQEYIEKTDSLLQEIHFSMMASPEEMFDPEKIGDKNFNPFRNGDVLRESIFYGGEAAYHFQYRDLSLAKHEKDNDWFVDNKKFSIPQAKEVVNSIQEVQNDKINDVLEGMREKHPDTWTMLPAFTFTAQEIADHSGVDIDVVGNVIDAFCRPDDVSMDTFNALDDFNPMNAYPVKRLSNSEYLLFQNYSLVEALYETPFFWFNADGAYRDLAMQHRGEFTEEFSAERLRRVFGEGRVFINVDLVNSKNEKQGEIDVLVVFANRAIILQAKSKKLTIAARKGNDNSLKSDFKKAIQDSCDQALSCANLIQDDNIRLVGSDGIEIGINREFREIYPFCVVSDHYPALTFQARQFLKYSSNEIIMPPFVTDVFLVDVITEVLDSPLYFLSYINRRTKYGEKVISTHELTILSYHLKQNLWIDDEYTMMHLGDDICADLDLAMLTRREGAPGIDTPEGILTKYKGTFFDDIISGIEERDDAITVDLGFSLLSYSGDTIEMINDGISQLTKLGKRDGKHHDMTLAFSSDNSGLTIHCNDDPVSISGPRLEDHCVKRKYSVKADSWFGICIGTKDSRVRFGVNERYKWEQSDDMDDVVKDLPSPHDIRGKRKINISALRKKTKKIGRNSRCPCGSGKKYKKCCL